ncbi:hypothetical protein FSHL1_009533 [Fusarium sambucinum]
MFYGTAELLWENMVLLTLRVLTSVRRTRWLSFSSKEIPSFHQLVTMEYMLQHGGDTAEITMREWKHFWRKVFDCWNSAQLANVDVRTSMFGRRCSDVDVRMRRRTVPGSNVNYKK